MTLIPFHSPSVQASGLTLIHNVTGTSSTMVYPSIENNDIVIVIASAVAQVPISTAFAGWNKVTSGTVIQEREWGQQVSQTFVRYAYLSTRFMAGASSMTGTRITPTISGGVSAVPLRVVVFRGLSTPPALTLLGTAVAGATSFSQTINYSGTTPCLNGLAMLFGTQTTAVSFPTGVTFGGVLGTSYPPAASVLHGAAVVLENLPAAAVSKTVATSGAPATTYYRAFVIR